MHIFKSLPFIITLCATALLSPFFFPFSISLILSVMAGFYLPVLPIIIGLTVDLLFYAGSSLPLGLVHGVIISLAILVVRYVVRTRIM
jgi:hypothetical protein